MAKQNFEATTTINNKVFFQGEADVSDADGELLSGSAKSPQTESSTFPEDYPGFEVLGQVEGMTPEKLKAMSDEDILKIDGIGPATLKAIRANQGK